MIVGNRVRLLVDVPTAAAAIGSLLGVEVLPTGTLGVVRAVYHDDDDCYVVELPDGTRVNFFENEVGTLIEVLP